MHDFAGIIGYVIGSVITGAVIWFVASMRTK